MSLSSGFDQLRYRDGTSQAQRKLSALDPDYFQMDERTIEDLLLFAQQYGKELQYFNEINEPEGSWSEFLAGDAKEMAAFLEDPAIFDAQAEKKALYSRPHLVLFLTFLKLLQHAKKQMNQLTERHLEFYYREALLLKNQEAVPDQVFLIAELDDQVDQVLIAQGTGFLAGQDAEGEDRMYQSEGELLANRAKIAQIMGLHVEKEEIGLAQIKELDESELDGGFYKMLQLVYGDAGFNSILPDFPDGSRSSLVHSMSPELIQGLDDIIRFITQNLHLRLTTYRRIISLFSKWNNEKSWDLINQLLSKAYEKRTDNLPSFFLDNINDPQNFDDNFFNAIGFDPQDRTAFDGLSEVNSLYDLYRVYLRVKHEKEDLSKSDGEREQANAKYLRFRAFILRSLNPLNPERERYGLSFPDPGANADLIDFEALMKARMQGVNALRGILDILRNVIQTEDLDLTNHAKTINEFSYLNNFTSLGNHLLESYFHEFLGQEFEPQIYPFIEPHLDSINTHQVQNYSWTLYYDEILATLSNYFKLKLGEYQFIRTVFWAEHPDDLLSDLDNSPPLSSGLQEENRQADWKWERIFRLFTKAHKQVLFHTPERFPEKFFEEIILLPLDQTEQEFTLKLTGSPIKGLNASDFQISNPEFTQIKVLSYKESTKELTFDLSLAQGEADITLNYQDSEIVIPEDVAPLETRWKDVYLAKDATQVSIPARTDFELPRWKTFGQSGNHQAIQLGKIGFAIASPILQLSEGKRTLHLSLNFAEKDYLNNQHRLLENLDHLSHEEGKDLFPFEFLVSTEKGMLAVSRLKKVYTGRIEFSDTHFYDYGIQFVLEIDETLPPLIPVPDESAISTWPILEIRLRKALIPVDQGAGRTSSFQKRYELFRELNIQSLRLDVAVEGLSSLLLQNDETDPDASKPFEPFGISPLVGNSLYISHPELVSQRLDQLDLHLDWMNLPEVELGEYYKAYRELAKSTDLSININSSQSFQAKLSFQDGRNQQELLHTHAIFPTSTFTQIQQLPEDRNALEFSFQLSREPVQGLLPEDFTFISSEGQLSVRIYDEGTRTLTIDLENRRPNQEEVSISYKATEIVLSVLDLPATVEKAGTNYHRLAELGVEDDVLSSERYIQLQLLGIDFQHNNYPVLVDRQAHFMVNGLFFENGAEEALPSLDADREYMLKKKAVPGLSKESFIITGSAIQVTDYDEKSGKITLSGSDPNAKINYRHNPYQDLILYPPFIPILKGINLSYSTHLEVNLEEERDQKEDQLLHLTAFGFEKLEIEQESSLSSEKLTEHSLDTTEAIDEATIAEKVFRLIPAYDHEGELYLGISDLKAPQSLSILFQMAEGSANPELKASNISWHYLSGSVWKSLEEGAMISDSTRGLLTSGIMRFALPADISLEHTQVPKDLAWIRARVEKHADSISDTVAILTQAIKAVFVDENNSPKHYEQALASETITETSIPLPGLSSITQNYPSFRGKAPEEKKAFYTRVSERLRHKQRALSLWDYERLVLEHFPEIYKAKALPTDLLKDPTELGKVELILIPNITGKQLYDPFEPKVSQDLLDEISEFLEKLAPPFADIRVKNPRYYYLVVKVAVRFRDMSNPGYYLQELDRELREYLSPWAYSNSSEIVFGGEIYESVIVNFLETRPYVDFINAPSLIIQRKEADGNIKAVEPLHRGEDGHIEIREADVIVASSAQHRLELIPDEAVGLDLLNQGIGYLEIELDFQIDTN